MALSDAAVRAVSGESGRHAALIEDAFGVLMETPGGGVALSGDAKARNQAKSAIQSLAGRADQGLEINEFSRAKIDASVAELADEQAAVKELGLI